MRQSSCTSSANESVSYKTLPSPSLLFCIQPLPHCSDICRIFVIPFIEEYSEGLLRRSGKSRTGTLIILDWCTSHRFLLWSREISEGYIIMWPAAANLGGGKVAAAFHVEAILEVKRKFIFLQNFNEFTIYISTDVFELYNLDQRSVNNHIWLRRNRCIGVVLGNKAGTTGAWLENFCQHPSRQPGVYWLCTSNAYFTKTVHTNVSYLQMNTVFLCRAFLHLQDPLPTFLFLI